MGMEAAERMIRKAELPAVVRRLFGERMFRHGLKARRDKIRETICAQLIEELNPPTESVEKTVRMIAESIEQQLDKMKERAALLIH